MCKLSDIQEQLLTLQASLPEGARASRCKIVKELLQRQKELEELRKQ